MPVIPFSTISSSDPLEPNYLHMMLYGGAGKGKTLTASKAIAHLLKTHSSKNLKIGILDTENATNTLRRYFRERGVTNHTILQCKISEETHPAAIVDTMSSFTQEGSNKCDIIVIDSFTDIGNWIKEYCDKNCGKGKLYTQYNVERGIKTLVHKIIQKTAYFKGHIFVLAKEAAVWKDIDDASGKEEKAEGVKDTEYYVMLSMRLFFETGKDGKRTYKADIRKNRYNLDNREPIVECPDNWICNMIDKLESNPTLDTQATIKS